MSASERIGLTGNEAKAYSCLILAVVSIGWTAVAFSLSYAPIKWADEVLLGLTIAWSPYSYIGLLVIGTISLIIGYRFFRRIDFGETAVENS